MERFVRLKCSHFQSYEMDTLGCKHKAGCNCPNYLQVCVREDKDRSCLACKAVILASLGIASPSLRKM